MPCYSTIRTKLTDGTKIEAALRALGFDASQEGNRILSYNKDRGTFIRFLKGSDGTYAVNGDTTNLAAISRKYAEIGVREWARKKGYAVMDTSDRGLTLTNRRA